MNSQQPKEDDEAEEREKKKKKRVDDSQREEWSRHYDTIHWNVISIFTPVICALAAYALSQPSNSELGYNASRATCTLAFLSVFYVASFRKRRIDLHADIDSDFLKTMIKGNKSQWLSTWNLFVLLFGTVVWLTGRQIGLQQPFSHIVVGIELFAIFLCWIWARD